jgi:tripartite ATP-independent transporter DctM subunit
MSAVTIGILGILLLFLLLAMRMQIGFSMAVVGFLGFAVLSSTSSSFSILGMEPFKIGAAYSLTVIPLFILMGQFANYSKMGFEIYQTVYRWIGFLPGGLSMATVGACGGFAAISGSSLAAAATFGMVAYPEMKRFEYDDSLATGCIAAGGTLGILIPPSTVMIIYGILTEQPIATLFIAGVLPGLLLCGLFIATIYITRTSRTEIYDEGEDLLPERYVEHPDAVPAGRWRPVYGLVHTHGSRRGRGIRGFYHHYRQKTAHMEKPDGFID